MNDIEFLQWSGRCNDDHGPPIAQTSSQNGDGVTIENGGFVRVTASEPMTPLEAERLAAEIIRAARLARSHAVRHRRLGEY